ATVAAQFAGEFEAVGVEPFWTLDILNDWVSFSRLNLPAVGALPGERKLGARGMRLEAGPMLVALVEKPCVHSSGVAYRYTATVRYDRVTYEGCARERAVDEAVNAWANGLVDLLAPIDACLGRSRRPASQVTHAYPLNPQEVSVRLLDSDGGRYECIVARSGGGVRYFEPIGDSDVLSGERDPLFTRAPEEPPAAPCLKSEEAPGGIGWLTRRVC
ncbi:MAG: hypothetical protein K2P95_02840, partial [Hyphomonadaceae bacterium]|nr:hypothetical protein [Hyphomonadaceae bacterium]